MFATPSVNLIKIRQPSVNLIKIIPALASTHHHKPLFFSKCVTPQKRICTLLADQMSTPVPTNTVVTPKPATQAAGAAPTADPLPSAATMLQAAKLAMTDDRAIMLDYYVGSFKETAFLGEDPETKERILVKSKEEFTSLISKLYKVGEDFIVLTENSIYIVSGAIKKRKVNLAALQAAFDN